MFDTMLLARSNQGTWDGRVVYHVWEKSVHTKFLWTWRKGTTLRTRRKLDYSAEMIREYEIVW